MDRMRDNLFVSSGEALRSDPAPATEGIARTRDGARLAYSVQGEGEKHVALVHSLAMDRHFWQPVVVLFTFPAITYTAITFGIILASFAAETTIQATYLLDPPYNFTAAGVGLMNLPPFIGAILGFPFGGWLNDKSIRWYAARNHGIYEPEMRLWMVLPFAILIPGGILMFGLGLAYVSPHLTLACGTIH